MTLIPDRLTCVSVCCSSRPDKARHTQPFHFFSALVLGSTQDGLNLIKLLHFYSPCAQFQAQCMVQGMACSKLSAFNFRGIWHQCSLHQPIKKLIAASYLVIWQRGMTNDKRVLESSIKKALFEINRKHSTPSIRWRMIRNHNSTISACQFSSTNHHSSLSAQSLQLTCLWTANTVSRLF